MNGLRAALSVSGRLNRLATGRNRTPEVLAVLSFAVATGALLITLGGLHAFVSRDDAAPGRGLAGLYVALAVVASGLLLAPVLTLGAVAARLTVGRRNQRLAALRLTGATNLQVTAMTVAECARLALAGAVVGVALYAALLPVGAQLTFQRRSLGVAELWLGVPAVLAVVGAVVVLAIGSAGVGLRRVVISPLGVAARHTPARLSVIRVVLTGAVFVVWFGLATTLGHLGLGVVLALVVAVVAVPNVVGPFVVMLLGLLAARLARRPATLLAARRLIDDPRSTWRSVGLLGMGITVAGLSGFFAATPAADGADPASVTLQHDIGTGSLAVLAIVAVVAATSTGVVQAARVIDQREQYHALALAGTDLAILHAARLREVTLPLGVTVGLGALASLFILVPFGGVLGPAVLLRLAAGVAAACGLTIVAVLASRSLVRDATGT